VYGKKRRNILIVAAMESSRHETLELLLFNDYVKFNVNQTDDYARHAIFYAVINNDLKGVGSLIARESHLDFPDNAGKCIIDYAMEGNYPEVILLLVKVGIRLSGAMHSAKGTKLTLYAGDEGNIDLLKSLIQKGVPLSSCDPKTG